MQEAISKAGNMVGDEVRIMALKLKQGLMTDRAEIETETSCKNGAKQDKAEASS